VRQDETALSPMLLKIVTVQLDSCSMNNAISVESVSKFFRLYHERNQSLKATITRGRRSRYESFLAVKDVSFTVPVGSTFGIIGSNGAGKSTLMKCLAGVLSPDSGAIHTNGRLVALLELGAGFHPELSGRENVFLNGAILGMKQEEIKAKFEEIVDFSGLERFIDTPIKNYSSGMVVRLGFAIAINVDPDILIIDEVLAVGDEAFQIKCNEKIEDFRRRGKTIVLVSHGLGTVRQLCDQVLWLDGGNVRAVGNAHEVISQYLAFSNRDDESISTETIVNRFGSGKIRIESFQLSDGSTNKTRVFPTGTPLNITLKVRNYSYVGEGYVQLAFHDLHGTTIWQSGLNSCQVIFGREDNEEIEVSCTVASFPVLEGSFRVSASIVNETGTSTFDHADEITKFTVLNESSLDSGLVLVEPKWNTSTPSHISADK